MDNRKIYIPLFFVLILALLFSSYIAVQRMGYEKANRNVEVVVDYSQIWELAKRNNVDIREVLEKLKESGVTGILAKEQLIDDLEAQGFLYIKSGAELALDENLSFRENIKKDYTYFITPFPEIYDRLKTHLDAKVGGIEAFTEENRGLYYVGSPLSARILNLEGIGVGFPEEGIKASQELGLSFIPQIRTWPEAKVSSFDAVFEQLEGVPNISVLAFNDPYVPGYPHLLPELKEQVKKIGAPVALIEFFDQKGLKKLALDLGKNAVKLHSISSDEMINITPSRALDRYVLAASERNVRVILVRLFQNVSSVSWLDFNSAYIKELRSQLESEGLHPGTAKPFGSFPISYLMLGVIGSGVAAGGIILLLQVMDKKTSILLGFCGVLIYGLLFFFDINTARKFMAFASAVIFPTLAVVSTYDTERKSMNASILNLIKAVLISMIGALFIVGLLSGTGFMIGLDQFSGVKASLLAPLILIPLFLVLKHDKDNPIKISAEILNDFVRYKWLFALGILALAGAVMLVRSGNEAGMVSEIEIRFREMLRELLLVRPRTKEFLLGHPIMLISYYLGYRRKYIPLVVLGSIGQVSLVNTFEHLHTPLVISIIRTFNGLWMGILVGAAVILACEFLGKWGKRVLNA
ncbi:MAG TPA: hypothetical protein DEA47_05980 [Peptococcaceae bacterium]|nr:MAG: Uncharacterized protein XD50_0897 [Clostridia bacterium 41_269]HBT20891.1 hypothetical protein [Peptococcaceae bacterium]